MAAPPLQNSAGRRALAVLTLFFSPADAGLFCATFKSGGSTLYFPVISLYPHRKGNDESSGSHCSGRCTIPQAVAHQAPRGARLAAAHLDIDVQPQWLPTETLTSPTSCKISMPSGWCGQYRYDDGAFMAIRHARKTTPFLGSCGALSVRHHRVRPQR